MDSIDSFILYTGAFTIITLVIRAYYLEKRVKLLEHKTKTLMNTIIPLLGMRPEEFQQNYVSKTSVNQTQVNSVNSTQIIK